MPNDILYGQINIERKYSSLLDLDCMKRLEEVSLSAVPPKYLPIREMAGRLEHSLGVAHLGKIVCESRELKDYRDVIIAASLLHDVGSAPFSHLSEPFQKKVVGKSHEDYAGLVLQKYEDEFKKLDLEPKEIAKIIKGEGVGKILNAGDSIDIDNLDNSLRYGKYAGIIRKQHYNPEYLARNLYFENGGLHLKDSKKIEEHKKSYEESRKKVYEKFVYSDTNLSPSSMLFRAIGFVYLEGELMENFFTFTDTEALEFLATKCNETTGYLMDKLNNKEFYKKAGEILTKEPSKELRYLCKNQKQRLTSANNIAEKFAIPQEDVCITAIKSKAVKGEKKPYYLAKIFVNPDLKIDKEEIMDKLF